jgi:hypothetical protein
MLSLTTQAQAQSAAPEGAFTEKRSCYAVPKSAMSAD